MPGTGLDGIGIRLERRDKMNLTGDFAESARWVQVVADGIMREGLDLRVRQTCLAKSFHRQLDQFAANAVAAVTGIDANVGNITDASFMVHPSGNKPDRATPILGHDDSFAITHQIFIQVPTLSPAPISLIDFAKDIFDPLVNRNAFEGIQHDRAQRFQILRSIRSISNVDHQVRFPDFVSEIGKGLISTLPSGLAATPTKHPQPRSSGPPGQKCDSFAKSIPADRTNPLGERLFNASQIGYCGNAAGAVSW
jgi:hypothetical protein